MIRRTLRRVLGVDRGRDERVVEALAAARAAMERAAAAEARLDALEQHLGLAADGTDRVSRLEATLAKASQQATRALTTAESTADGLDGVEAELAALCERLPDLSA